jgi:hypothetical protein
MTQVEMSTRLYTIRGWNRRMSRSRTRRDFQSRSYTRDFEEDEAGAKQDFNLRDCAAGGWVILIYAEIVKCQAEARLYECPAAASFAYYVGRPTSSSESADFSD